MADFSITRLDPITKTGDSAIQSSQSHTGSRHRRPHQDPSDPEPDDVETTEEEKHDLDRLA
jgi:hypothetical protein